MWNFLGLILWIMCTNTVNTGIYSKMKQTIEILHQQHFHLNLCWRKLTATWSKESKVFFTFTVTKTQKTAKAINIKVNEVEDYKSKPFYLDFVETAKLSSSNPSEWTCLMFYQHKMKKSTSAGWPIAGILFPWHQHITSYKRPLNDVRSTFFPLSFEIIHSVYITNRHFESNTFIACLFQSLSKTMDDLRERFQINWGALQSIFWQSTMNMSNIDPTVNNLARNFLSFARKMFVISTSKEYTMSMVHLRV